MSSSARTQWCGSEAPHGPHVGRNRRGEPVTCLGFVTVDRVKDHRDLEREHGANAYYEELRLLTKDELYARAGLTSPKGHPRGAYASFSRQELIAMIINNEGGSA